MLYFRPQGILLLHRERLREEADGKVRWLDSEWQQAIPLFGNEDGEETATPECLYVGAVDSMVRSRLLPRFFAFKVVFVARQWFNSRGARSGYSKCKSRSVCLAHVPMRRSRFRHSPPTGCASRVIRIRTHQRCVFFHHPRSTISSRLEFSKTRSFMSIFVSSLAGWKIANHLI